MPFPAVASPPTLFPTYLVPSLPFRPRTSSTASPATCSSSLSSTNDSGASSSPSSPSPSPSTSTSTSPPSPVSYLAGHTSHLRCARCATDLALSSQIISKGFTGRHGRAYLVSPPAASPGTTIPSNNHNYNTRNDPTDDPDYDDYDHDHDENSSNTNNDTDGISASPSSSSSLPLSLLLRRHRRRPLRPSPRRHSHDQPLPDLANTYTHKPVPRQLVTGAHTVGDISCAVCGSVVGWKYVSAEEEGQRYKVGKFILETKRVCRSSTWEGGEEDQPQHSTAHPARLRGCGGGATGSGGGGGAGGRSRTRKTDSLDPSCGYDYSEAGYAHDEDDSAAPEFDSQDEDECEDLFLGLWTPQLARARKRGLLPAV